MPGIQWLGSVPNEPWSSIGKGINLGVGYHQAKKSKEREGFKATLQILLNPRLPQSVRAELIKQPKLREGIEKYLPGAPVDTYLKAIASLGQDKEGTARDDRLKRELSKVKQEAAKTGGTISLAGGMPLNEQLSSAQKLLAKHTSGQYQQAEAIGSAETTEKRKEDTLFSMALAAAKKQLDAGGDKEDLYRKMMNAFAHDKDKVLVIKKFFYPPSDDMMEKLGAIFGGR